MRYAFTFGSAYDLSDAYVLVDAVDQEAAIGEFMHARAQIVADLPNQEFRWSSCVPFVGTIEDMLTATHRLVDISTPVRFSRSHPAPTGMVEQPQG